MYDGRMLLTDKIEIFVQLFCIDRPVEVWLALTRPTAVAVAGAAFWAYALSAIALIKSIPSFICDRCEYSVTVLRVCIFIRMALFIPKIATRRLKSNHFWKQEKTNKHNGLVELVQNLTLNNRNSLDWLNFVLWFNWR